MTDDKGDWASYKYGVEVMISAVNDILDGNHDIGKYDDYEPWNSLRQRLKALVAETKRLDWMSRNEAWIEWNREGDLCRVCHVNEDDEEDPHPQPVCGWERLFDNPRAAIDAAMEVLS